MIGKSHLARGTRCQDAHSHAIEGDLCIIAVADGVGSARRSELGAQAATEAAVQHLRKQTAGPPGAEPWRERLADAAKQALMAVEEIAGRENHDLRDLASTLLLVVAGESFVAALQIGDGAIVASLETESLKALTKPRKGEFVNEVLPLTSRGALSAAQIVVVTGRPRAIAMFTDGLEALALNLATGQPHERFFAPIFDLATRVSAEDLAAEIEELFDKRVKQRSDDDLTLAVAIRVDATTQPRPLEQEAGTTPAGYAGTTVPLLNERQSRAGTPSRPPGSPVQLPQTRATADPRGTPRTPTILALGCAMASAAIFALGFTLGARRDDSSALPFPHSAGATCEPAPSLADSPPTQSLMGVLEPCWEDANCERWLSCVNDLCIQRANFGEPCGSEEECQPGLNCSDAVCSPPKGKRPHSKCPDCPGSLCVQGECRWTRLGAGRVRGRRRLCSESLRCVDGYCRTEER